MPELLGRSKTARAQVDMLAGVLSGVRSFIDDKCLEGDLSQRHLATAVMTKFGEIAAFLLGKQFLLGDELCYLDFYLFELL